MPRTKNSNNKTNYHYKVLEFNNNDKEELINTMYFISQKDLGIKYNMNRSAIYHTLHKNNHRVKKYSFLDIQKLTPPMPIYQPQLIQY